MDFTGRYVIPAPTDAVWAALNDPEILKYCIPGCEQLEKTSPTDFAAVATLKIGPLKASFRGKVTLTDLEPPFRCKLSARARAASRASRKARRTSSSRRKEPAPRSPTRRTHRWAASWRRSASA